MRDKLKDHLDWSLDTDLGEKKPISYTSLRNKGFVNFDGIAVIELPNVTKDYTLYHENGKTYAIPLSYKVNTVPSGVTDDEQVSV
jgi:hypothetical protein